MSTRKARSHDDTPSLMSDAYVARVRLTDRSGRVLAEVGESCQRVDPVSLPWLLEQGLIAPAARGGDD